MTNPDGDTTGANESSSAAPTLSMSDMMQFMLTQTATMNALQASITQLQQTQTTAPAVAPAVAPGEPALPTGPAYVPPITVNPAAGASPSPSLLSQFPTVEAATITSIVQHDLRANELYKLDSRYRDKSDRQILEFNGTNLEVSSRDTVAKEYKSLNSVSVPIAIYFSILIAAITLNEVRTISQHFLWYTAHLVRLSVDYEWSAVLSYHTDFFNKRHCEMSGGDYTGWGRLDHDLDDLHLHGRRKHTASVKQPAAGGSSTKTSSARPSGGGTCRNFNKGKCATTLCSWGRNHACSTCGKSDHGAHNHPSN